MNVFKEAAKCGTAKAATLNNWGLSLFDSEDWEGARDRFDAAEREGLLSCIECGCCDYVCPSQRPMVHLFRHAKHQLLET